MAFGHPGSPPAEPVFGPLLIGNALDMVLYGITITQVLFFYTSFKNESWGLRTFVGALFAVETFKFVRDIAFMYHIFIINFANLLVLFRADWFYACSPAVTSTTAVAVQLFYARRVRILVGGWIAPVLIALTAFGAWLTGIGVTVALVMVPEFEEYRKYSGIVGAWAVLDAVCDILITVVLTWNLSHRKTGYRSTDTVTDKIIRLTIQNGLVTTICAILGIAFFYGSPTGLHTIPSLLLGSLYTNTAFSILNSRGALRRELATENVHGDRERATPPPPRALRAQMSAITFAVNTDTLNTGTQELSPTETNTTDERSVTEADRWSGELEGKQKEEV